MTFTAINTANLSTTASVVIQVSVARPAVTGVFNAASFVKNAVCSPGALGSIIGIGFTTQDPQQPVELPFPKQLAGVRALANGSPVPLFYASATLINFQCPMLPTETALDLVIETEGGTVIPAFRSAMREVTPGLYSLNASGEGQGAITITLTGEVAMLKTERIPSRPAHPGEYISIYANGLGPIKDGSIEAGSPAPLDRLFWTKNPVRIVIDNKEVEPSFAGLAPGAIGLFESTLNCRMM